MEVGHTITQCSRSTQILRMFRQDTNEAVGTAVQVVARTVLKLL
jgi:hypothetical protein